MVNEKNGEESQEEESIDSELEAEVEEPLVFEEPLDAAIRERDELKALVQRVQADFVNYRNRVAIERDEIRRNSTERLSLKVLEAVDQFDTALGSERPVGIDESWFDGFVGIHRSLLRVLSSEGIEPFESVGELFDPRKHEALLTAQSADVPASTILTVLRKGYMMNEEVMRAAQVQISTSPIEESDLGEESDE